MIVVVWGAAFAGIAIKMFLPGRYDRLAIVFYLAIGWSGVVLAGPLVRTLPTTSVALLVAGGMVYSLGVIFFAWKGLRFHNAVWHGFVVTGAGLHLAAMVDCLVVNRF
jgi:hemolysin III